MAVKEFSVKFVLNETSDLYSKWQWRSLVPKSVLVELQAFFWIVMTDSVTDSVTESAFTLYSEGVCF